MNTGYLEIINSNGQASIQDLGRLNAQHLGFSASGAADEFAFLSANKLIAHYYNLEQVGDMQGQCAAIEITLGQISFKAQAACTIAITGADCEVKINDIAVKNWQCHQIHANDIIDFAMPKRELHSYLAVLGGITCQLAQQPWLGSFAQTKNEMSLGFTGERLTTGSKLYFSAHSNVCSKNSSQPMNQRPHSSAQAKLFYAKEKLTLRLIASRLFLQMSSSQQQSFFATDYVISPESNRMGYRLNAKHSTKSCSNKKILSESLRKQCLLSKPVTYGMVQFPANEQPIILMKERQTMGGYPVLGTVMQTDLFRLSQMRPGEKVNFTLVSQQKAQQQLQAFYQKFC